MQLRSWYGMKTLSETETVNRPFLPVTHIPWLQRSAVTPEGGRSVPPIVHEVLHSPGQRLDAGVCAFMEPRFGYDFSGVRVHADAKAAESARAVNAQAYTVGQDIVFGVGQYAPATQGGNQLLAHELVHSVQQTKKEPGISLAIARSEAVDEAEADHIATAIVTGSRHRPTVGASALALRRSNSPRISDSERQARQAEMLCDIAGLCRLHSSAPDVATEARIRATARRCYPTTLITMNPCLMPAFMLPPTLPLPSTMPPTTAPSSSSGLPDISLSKLTTHKLDIKIGSFEIVLPKSAGAKTFGHPIGGWSHDADQCQGRDRRIGKAV